MLSIFPWTRFPGWQWLLVALAVPVATCAAWPFHQAALRQARHLSSLMVTLVSLGILAACGWSVYAMFVLDRGRGGPGGLQNLLHGSGGGIYLEVAASVTTFLLAGRLYEAHARRTAGQAMRDLAAASAKDVCLLGDDETEHWIPAGRLRSSRYRQGNDVAALTPPRPLTCRRPGTARNIASGPSWLARLYARHSHADERSLAAAQRAGG